MLLQRLDKFLSENTKFSRSEIKKMVRSGRVMVDGLTVKTSDLHINPQTADILVDAQPIRYKKFVYLALNKPSGILSASNDKTRKTVVDLVGDDFNHYSLFPVGRLDKDTTGLLILTNDGDFAHKVISPKSNIEKSYIATVDTTPPKDLPKNFFDGITLVDGTVCKSAVAEILDERTVRIILREGKYHQIKRMLGTQGLGVVKLHRERIGELLLKPDLQSGEYYEITPKDIGL